MCSLLIQLFIFYPFKLNEISHYYHLEKSIFNLWRAGWYFSFFPNFNITCCKQTMENLIRRHFLQRLFCVCNKKADILYGLRVKLFTSALKCLKYWPINRSNSIEFFSMLNRRLIMNRKLKIRGSYMSAHVLLNL